VVRPLPPSQVENLERVGALPALLAGLVAVLGTATIVHATATTVRRRRRDLAMLTGMGFVRRQVSATLAWQATAVAVVALAVGVPVGVAAGRWAWRLTADALWVVSSPEVRLLPVVLVGVAALVVVNVAALGAGVLVRTATPAAALRTE
jgi:predicted lysophospholipase L1 biosynthesis ABC-type transport system permease subunit